MAMENRLGGIQGHDPLHRMLAAVGGRTGATVFRPIAELKSDCRAAGRNHTVERKIVKDRFSSPGRSKCNFGSRRFGGDRRGEFRGAPAVDGSPWRPAAWIC